MIVPLAGHTAVATIATGQGNWSTALVCGGTNESVVALSACYAYSIEADVWMLAAPLNTARWFHGMAVYKGETGYLMLHFSIYIFKVGLRIYINIFAKFLGAFFYRFPDKKYN